MQFGTVTGRFLATIADRVNDPDADPDLVPVVGTVRFTPSVTSVISSAEDAIVMPTPIEAELDSEGYLSLNGTRGVTLVATDSPDLNPTGFTYTVSFIDLKFDKFNLTYKSFSMALPANSTVDLSTVTPVGSSNGVTIIQGPKGDKGDKGDKGEPGIAGAPGIGALTRNVVYFGDSWGTQLYAGTAPLPDQLVARIGGTLVKNYAVAGAIIGPTSQNSGNATDAQVTTAQVDTTYDKSSVTDVVVLAGINNIGGYLPTVDQARGHFQSIANLYPKARFWYAANGKKAINNAGDSDPWRWYSRLFEGAGLAGYAVAEFSPMWTWGSLRDTAAWWPSDSVDSSRHPSAVGFTAVAGRLAGFLTGESWRPYLKVSTTIHANAAALMTAQGVSGTPAIATDDTTIDGATLRLNVTVSGMDALVSVGTGAYQAVVQIPTGYMPTGNYLIAPTGCRLSSGTMDFTYAMRVNSDGAGVISVDPRLLNNHVGYFTLRGDFPLNVIKAA